MPYEGSPRRHTAIATKVCGHGQVVVEDNHVGTAFKVEPLSRFTDPSAVSGGRLVAQTIDVNEEFEIQVGGIHQAPRSGALDAADVGDRVWINPVDNSLLAAPTAGGTNEIQHIAVDAAGGTFDVTFDGETAADLAFDISAANLRAALEGLSNIDPGDVTVSGGPGAAGGATPYVITFTGGYAGANVPALTTDPANLTGGAGTAAVTTATPGVAGAGSLPVGVVDEVDTTRDVVLINPTAWQAFLPGA